MSLKWIRKNQQFCLFLLGGCLFFFLSFHFVSRIFSQTREIYQEIREKEEAIREILEKLRSKQGLAYERELAPLLEKKVLPRLYQKLLYTPSADYLVTKVENPAFYFSSKKAQVEEQLSLKADRRGFTLPSISLSPEKVTQENLKESLYRLSLAEFVLLQAMEAGFRRALTVDGEKEIERFPIPGTSYELRWIPLYVVLEGSHEATIELLRRFAKKTTSQEHPPLEVLECTLQPLSGQENLTVHLTLGALQVGKATRPAKQQAPSREDLWERGGWGGFRRIR